MQLIKNDETCVYYKKFFGRNWLVGTFLRYHLILNMWWTEVIWEYFLSWNMVTYQFKIGDKVQILCDLNNTKKNLSKKPKFASLFLELPVQITKILQNNTWKGGQ